MVTRGAAIRAGLRYGGLAFLAGALLGPLRELVLAPRIGGLAAAWIEAAGMAILLWLAAGAAPPARHDRHARTTMALVALAVVLVAEVALSWMFASTGLADVRAPRSLAEQAPGVLLLAWLVAVPFLRREN